MKAQKVSRPVQLSLPLTFLAAVLLSGCITLLVLYLQPNSFRNLISIFLQKPILIVLNAMPIGLLVLIFTFLFQNVFYGAALVNLVMCGLSVANRIKIQVRDEPVFPRDLALLKEAADAAGAYDIQLPWLLLALILLATLALLLIGYFIHCEPVGSQKLRGWLSRLLGTAINLVLLVILTVTVLGSSLLYRNIGSSNPYRLSTVFNETGFLYSFFHQFTTYEVDKPAGFHRNTAEAWEAEYAAEEASQPVHVIMVMNEAFSNISDAFAFAYDESSDPLANLHALQSDPHAVTGHLVVPGFAGGTANTEFDVLTGIQTNTISATTTSSMRVVHRNLDSLFRAFGEDGYATSYAHCGNDWFYNRENVLRWLGADETTFIDQMKDVDYKGNWVSDDYMAGLVEAEFEEAVAAGQLLFHCATTIQNHMAYTENKYGDNVSYPEVPLNISASESVETMLEVYMEGVRDADAMLGRLRDYFEERSEPVVLVFYGDHLPYLGDNQLGYAELGFTEQEYWSELLSYETPFVIWVNDKAYEMLDWSKAEALPQRLSASFLGAAVLELTGHENAWFSFLNDVRREAPVIHKQTAVLSDGSVMVESGVAAGTSTGANIPETVEKWRQWSYYKLKYQKFEK